MHDNEPAAPTPATGREDHWISHVLSCAIAAAAAGYLCLFWVQMRPWMPAWLIRAGRDARVYASDKVIAVAQAACGWTPDRRWTWALYSVALALVVPWLMMVVFGRGQPRDLGLRWPNRVGWRILAVGYVASLPLLALMASSAATQEYYRRELFGSSLGAIVAPYLAVLVAEHFLFNGVLLAILRPRRRWPVVPPPAPAIGGRARIALRWIGLAQPADGARGWQRGTRWIGLPDACLLALVLQSILFGLIHVGKSPAECAMSFPGGLALGYVAYRCNSWLVPMMLHLLTGVTVVALIWLWLP